MIAPATKSQVNKLGEELRHRETPDAETLRRLQDLRALFQEPMSRARGLLTERLNVEPHARLKTVNTIVDKLRREKTRLAEMQDIAGLRIVAEMGLRQQDRMVERIVEVFPAARVVDRRKRPSHGYRAVHVIVDVDGHLIEIQVRTRLQDLWAQAMEKLADELGRDIRYGGEPARGSDRVKALRGLADEVADVENLRNEISDLSKGLPHRPQASQRDIAIQKGKLVSQKKRFNKHLDSLEASIQNRVAAIVKLEGG